MLLYRLCNLGQLYSVYLDVVNVRKFANVKPLTAQQVAMTKYLIPLKILATFRSTFKLTATIKQRTMHTSCPGTVDQKNPLQSGSSNIYGTNRVSSRTQFRTENHKN